MEKGGDVGKIHWPVNVINTKYRWKYESIKKWYFH